MAAKRLTMRNIHEILRLHFEAGLSIRQISKCTNASIGGVQKLLSKARSVGITWPVSDNVDDATLTALIYPKPAPHQAIRFQVPDWPALHQELKRKGVTKTLLWEEYAQQYPQRCYSYSQFCDRYKRWLKKQKRSMRQQHKAGEKLFVDYAGQTVPIVNPDTGKVHPAQIFVAVMGASNYTWAEATWSQKLPDWLQSHVRCFEFLKGLPEIVVPDNLRSGVSKACRYDPNTNPAYQQLAAHYGVAVIPARPRKPQDKAKAEVGVQIIERWILARLRHHTFFTLSELNQCIRSLLTEVNHKPFRQLKGSRQSWFDTIDKPALGPLPSHPYQYADIKTVKVNVDYHIQYDGHLYSVPHHLVGERLECHATDKLITMYFKSQRITSHIRRFHHGMSTIAEHMPEAHQKHQKWTPGRLMNWAKDVGNEVLVWVKTLLEHKQHPEQAYRVCLGLLNMTRQYPPQRINNACLIANKHQLYRLKHIKDILNSNQDKLVSTTKEPAPVLPQSHENIRGPHSFH